VMHALVFRSCPARTQDAGTLTWLSPCKECHKNGQQRTTGSDKTGLPSVLGVGYPAERYVLATLQQPFNNVRVQQRGVGWGW